MTATSDADLVVDAEAEPADRVAAMKRLLDGPGDSRLGVVLESWLNGENAFLREEALVALLTRLHLEAYVSVALGWLDRDSVDPFAASAAAHALGGFVLATGCLRQQVCSALAQAVQRSDNPDVQRAAYLGVLAALGEPVAPIPSDFDRSRDVDWIRLQEFLA